MKILLSAHSCDPNEGSETAVGWNWMRSLANQGHDICVLTRPYHQKAIEAAVNTTGLSVRFVYYDLPAWLYRWKAWPIGNITLTFLWWSCYLLWQVGAYRRARRLHQTKPFDMVHHVTMAAFRAPSFMGGLGIPFIFGPVGGGEAAPRPLRRSFNRSGYIFELLRDLSNLIVKFDPLMQFTFSKATLIACTTPETMRNIPRRYHKKCTVLQAIGIEALPEIEPSCGDSPVTFLFIGRLLYWKGLQFALRALPEVLRLYPETRLKVIGKGRDAEWLKTVAKESGVANSVEWIPRIPYSEIADQYRHKLGFVFPSLRDSGGMVLLESMACGLPVICLKLGGPGVLVNQDCGIVIDADKVGEEEIQKALADAMIKFIENPELRRTMAINGMARVRRFGWASAARELYSSRLLSQAFASGSH
jgi:glycosyltransferase involved in cell wall biosynthesis